MSVWKADKSEPTSPAVAAATGGATASGARPEARRARIMLVGEALAAALRPRMERCAPEAAVTVVPNMLFAMGEAAQQPADVVISSADQFAGMAASASQCLRELLPESRLVVAVDAETAQQAADAEAALRGGFDVRLNEPIDDAALRAAVSGRGNRGANGAARPTPRVSADDADLAWGAPAVLPWGPPPDAPPASSAHEAGTARPASPLEALGLQAQADKSNPTTPASASATDETGDDVADWLGDVDLIEALLGAHERLDALALQLVTQRSGIKGLGWTCDPGQIPPGHVEAPVCYQQRDFGVLHAPADGLEASDAPETPDAPAQMLAGWAGWLGRWLALREHMSQLEALSMTDELTRAWNRRYFNRFLERILEQARNDRSQVTLLVFDIDDFKCYNDRYGHAAGDEILREATKLIQSFVREHDVVARIGGDEFAVIFWDAEQKRRPDSAHPHTVRQAAERFQKAICAHRFPKLLDEAPGTLTISAGLASFPWDGRTPEELLALADEMALQSKRQGKNAITFGPGARRACQRPDPSDSPEGEADDPLAT